MEKCFLGLWAGTLFGLAYAVSELSSPQAGIWHCLSGALEWMYIGAFLTVCALAVYALSLACERLRDRRR